MRMQPLLAYWLHSEVDEGAQEKRSLLSAHTYTPLQISTPSMRLQRRTRKARLDRGSCPTMRSVKGSPEDTSRPVNFAKRGNVSVFLWMLSSGGFVCDCDLCSSLNGGGAGRIGTPPWLQSAVGCKKGFYGCTSQMVWHGNETSIMKKFTHRTKS